MDGEELCGRRVARQCTVLLRAVAVDGEYAYLLFQRHMQGNVVESGMNHNAHHPSFFARLVDGIGSCVDTTTEITARIWQPFRCFFPEPCRPTPAGLAISG